MRDRTLYVLLEGERIGALEQDARGRLRFTYDERWIHDRDATPLSLSMPLSVAAHEHAVVEAFLWGLLPDNDKVLKRWGRDFHVSPRNPFALLAYVGEECAGAVQFVRQDRVAEATSGGHVQWWSRDEVAARITLLRRDPTAWQTPMDHGQFSLAGAQAKVALLREGELWGTPSGRIPTTHIVKPAIEGFDDHDLNEHLCLRAAQLLGLRAARSEVMQFADERAIVVERYDRIHGPAGTVRVHQEDVCQALGIMPTSKYQNDGGPSPGRIVALLREADPGASSDAVWRFLDALAFNWLIGGTDAHAKNYSILLSGPQVRLAPLYDVASALPYAHIDKRKLKLAMSIGHEYRFDWIRRDQWRRLAKELRLDSRHVVARVEELAVRVPECFARAASDTAVRELESPLPDELTDVIAARASDCLKLLSAA